VIVITTQWKEKLRIRNNCTIRKTTISFIAPKKDLYLRNYDELVFKAFMTLMARISANQLTTKLADVSALEKLRPKPTSLAVRDDAFTASDLSNKCLQKLSVERFRTIPRLVWKLNNLVELSLNGCELTEIPLKLNDLAPTLKILDVSRNHIRAIDGSFAVAMRHLRSLDVNHNKLAYIPLEIKAMTRLERLIVSHNELTHLAITLGLISALKCLDISHNQLNGLSFSMVRQLFLKTRLENLDTSGNPFKESAYRSSIVQNKPFPTLQNLCLARIVSTDCLLYSCHQFLPQTLYKAMQMNADKCCVCSEYVVDKQMILGVIPQSLEQIAVCLTSSGFPSFPKFPSTQYVCHLCLNNRTIV